MDAVLIIGLGSLLVMVIALAIIVGLALTRHSAQQWKSQVKTASHLVVDGQGLPDARGKVTVRSVSFAQLWKEESKKGEAAPMFAVSQQPLPSAVPELKRSSASQRFPKIISIPQWEAPLEDEDEDHAAERTVA